MSHRIKKGEIGVALLTLAYIAGFTVWFLSIGNYEFIFYVLTMLGLMLLVGLSLQAAAFPLPMLWALSIWGLLHMAGGGIPANGAVLYNLVIAPIYNSEEIVILKYDQAVHAYGFGVTAWLLHHLLTRHFPEAAGTATALVYPALGAMGLGAANEMIEFTAVLLVPDTNVGGYTNTALDLCFNALGAVVAVIVLAFLPADRSERMRNDT
ncbi:MAG: hypothetical protein HKN63_03230 [Rhodobacteraceae bacterium]|nr:hypothetical protein [Paracoccaceae bacterium]